MRINIFTKAILFSIILIAASAANAQQVFNGVLSGAQVVPGNNSTGGGNCRLVLNAQGNSVTGSCQFSLTSPASSIWIVAGTPRGENSSNPLRAIAVSGTSGFTQITVTGLTAQNVADLRANRWYISYRSNAFPLDEIRAQLKLANGTYNDYDGDGRADLVVYRISELTYYALGSMTGNWITKQVGQSGDSVSLNVDFDGDGKSDFSTARYNAEVLWRIARTSDGALQETRWGSSTLGDFFAAGDYDGDGASDIAVLRAGVWYIIESSTGNMRMEYFGQAGDPPAPNDYDRDGKADLTVARSEGGQRVWYTRRSSDGVVTATTWGLSGDAFFTGRADYDGDGAADYSVIRNVSGQRVFYILRSSDQQMQVIPWGLTSDLPKLADYDGDGKTDPAVTRATVGGKLFYILESSTGNVRIENWGLNGDF